jgi:hypothetical protein
MPVPYEKQTTNHPNPIARYSHRARLSHSKSIVMKFVQEKSIMLDYGCGQGMFLHEIHNELQKNKTSSKLYGYDPYMEGKYDGYEVVSDITQVSDNSVNIITCLEVCEHLDENETTEFINTASRKLTNEGVLLVTVPIMMGPSLLIKELSRSILFRGLPDLGFGQLIMASLFCVMPPRAENIKTSHRGYDWRITLKNLESIFALEKILFSPIPFIGWYGNSQAIMLFKKFPE